MEDLYYIQDKRSYVGNDMVWWSKGGGNYVCDILLAGTFTRGEALDINMNRETDVPWPKEYIDARMKHVIDMQDCLIDDALKGKKMGLRKPKRYRPTTGKTRGNCPKCGKVTWDLNPYENAYCSGSLATCKESHHG